MKTVSQELEPLDEPSALSLYGWHPPVHVSLHILPQVFTVPPSFTRVGEVRCDIIAGYNIGDGNWITREGNTHAHHICLETCTIGLTAVEARCYRRIVVWRHDDTR